MEETSEETAKKFLEQSQKAILKKFVEESQKKLLPPSTKATQRYTQRTFSQQPYRVAPIGYFLLGTSRVSCNSKASAPVEQFKFSICFRRFDGIFLLIVFFEILYETLGMLKFLRGYLQKHFHYPSLRFIPEFLPPLLLTFLHGGFYNILSFNCLPGI